MQNRRRKKLVRPKLQLRLTGAFVGIAALGILLQFLLMNRGLLLEAKEIPGAGGMLVDRIPGVTVRALVSTLVVVLPLLSIVGIWMTFRVAGPLVNFEKFLRAVAAGTQVDACRLRTGDELQDICDLINQATERERQAAAERFGLAADADDAAARDAA